MIGAFHEPKKFYSFLLSGCRRNPIAILFQAFIEAIIKVRSMSSLPSNCRLTNS